MSKLCSTCQFGPRWWWRWLLPVAIWECSHPYTYNNIRPSLLLVNGKIHPALRGLNAYCDEQRSGVWSHVEMCGIQGKWWEPRWRWLYRQLRNE